MVRRLTPTTSASHAIGNNGEDAAIYTRVLDDRDLVLLVLAVALVNASRSSESVTSGHVEVLMKQYFLQTESKVVLSSQHDDWCCSLNPYLLSTVRGNTLGNKSPFT